MSLPATRSDADGLDCHRNGITATADAPSRLALLSARPADGLPKAWSGVATMLKPSRRLPKAGSFPATEKASRSSNPNALRKDALRARRILPPDFSAPVLIPTAPPPECSVFEASHEN